MGINIPQNQIKYNYTSGNEYIYKNTYKKYQGYYYEVNGKLFAGKEFNVNSPELININSDNINILLKNPETSYYAEISKIQLNNSNNTYTSQVYIEDFSSEENVLRYFIKKINVTPIIIKEVTKESYEKALSDPFYISVVIDWTRGGFFNNVSKIDIADKIMPGIKIYLEDEPYVGDAYEG